jgi:hypothetical protein
MTTDGETGVGSSVGVAVGVGSGVREGATTAPVAVA